MKPPLRAISRLAAPQPRGWGMPRRVSRGGAPLWSVTEDLHGEETAAAVRVAATRRARARENVREGGKEGRKEGGARRRRQGVYACGACAACAPEGVCLEGEAPGYLHTPLGGLPAGTRPYPYTPNRGQPFIPHPLVNKILIGVLGGGALSSSSLRTCRRGFGTLSAGLQKRAFLAIAQKVKRVTPSQGAQRRRRHLGSAATVR